MEIIDDIGTSAATAGVKPEIKFFILPRVLIIFAACRRFFKRNYF